MDFSCRYVVDGFGRSYSKVETQSGQIVAAEVPSIDFRF